MVSGLRKGDSEGVCWLEAVPDAGFEVAREGVRDGTVWLSRVRRREVMITWGTW